MVQEALTNALRHAGPVPIRLCVRVDGRELRLVVENPVPVPVPAGPGAGSGVRGLRDRAAVLGGTALVGPAGEDWRVEVTLPVGGRA
jgi:signal transduction histidine kinase